MTRVPAGAADLVAPTAPGFGPFDDCFPTQPIAVGHGRAGLVPPAGSPPHISTAQLPAERTGEPAEYVRYEAGPPAHSAETWIRRYTQRASSGGH
jgi:hypothetical protein